jgi:phosphatidylinositol alpha-mannosyltransferase
VTTNFGPGEAPNEEHVIRIGRSFPVPSNGSIFPLAIDLRMRARVRRVLAAEQFDILHLHEPLVPTLCLAVLAESQIPTVGTFHANNDGALGYRIFRGPLDAYHRKLDARIAVSPAAVRTVATHFGGEYTVIPNGVDIERFSADVPRQKDGVFRILFVGRLEPRKGAKFLFKAMPRILSEVPHARLTVVGSGPMSGYYRSHLPDGVGDRVDFAGRVSGEELARHYAEADVFCSPAMGGESFGIVLIEAMAAGAAVVASDIAGYRDVVNDGATGLLTRPGDPDSIAEAVIRLERDDALMRRLVESAKEDVQQYSWKRVTRRILEVYCSVAEDGTGCEGEPGRPASVVVKSEEGAGIKVG